MNKDTKSVSEDDSTKYPSVDLAYNFVKPSYDWMVTRFDAINSKIQGLLTFSATLMVAIPILAKSIFNNISFISPCFIGAVATFIALVIAGIIGMQFGSIMLLHPKTLYSKYLHCSHWEFQQRVIYWAGEHFSKNKAIIDSKAIVRNVMTGALLIQILLFIFWMVVPV
jgi:hypothetical protein